MKGNILTTANATSTPTSEPPKKRSRKTLIAVVLIVVLVVAIITGVYLATRGNGGTNPSVTPTPTPTSNPSATTNPSTSGIGANIAGASSLQFTVSVTNSSGGTTSSYTYSAKNAGTSNMMIRVEFTDPTSGGSFVYIVNGAQQKAWMQTGGQWIDLTSSFSSEFNSWDSSFKDYQTNLGDWNGLNDWSYTVNGETVTINNISVNPSLPDSLFEHS